MLSSIAVALLFLTCTTLTLSLLLVLAEKWILNYGPCSIDVNNGQKKLDVLGGSSLLGSLAENEIFIPSACGGRGSCAYCKVKVLNGGGPVSPIESPYLSDQEIKDKVRLSCQVKVRQDIKVEIPDELFKAKRFQAVASSKKMLTYDTMELGLDLKEPGQIDFKAGQYIQLESAPYKGRDSVIRAYSISSLPSDQNRIELIMRRVPEGICTTWAFDHLEAGERIFFSGPYGEFKLQNTKAPAVFIAGGSGMAPIWSILRDMQERKISKKSIYFFSGRTFDDLFFTDELRALEKTLPDFKYIPCLTREPEDSGWTGERQRIPEVLPRYIPDASEYEAYLCGSSALIEACCAGLSRLGLKDEKMYFDKFE
ncbi:NADH:ubiquinone reductase (Na(+)-transporting) subunit F [Desulfonatronovibrio hydrogenovorans]|uniref:NADH:ubiquinone reductase (Na(+)-transporting) subunit F n=1 Tax=Desulfonatronovibrio hydrogenovorans TaxID=53245 RepID=UPI00048B270F|nr:2Fe-2S iron-sulfur cluster binding domain-containing protein [Desulfonatronovibrio hydrogenovorans]